jgi:nitric oxide reductase large subunit
MISRYQHGLRALFWIALAFALAKAFVLPRKMLRIFHWDKAEHFLAFYVLTLLAAAAFPRRPLWAIAVSLSLLGAGIEVVQGLPIISRDSDFWDWFADTLAITAALLPVAILSWRARQQRRSISSF